MKVTTVSCPYCNASLEIDKATTFCQYCRAKILVDTDEVLKIHRTENSIELGKLDTEYESLKKKANFEDFTEDLKRNAETKKITSALKLSAIVTIPCLIFMAVLGYFLINSNNDRNIEYERQFEIIVNEVNTLIENGDYELALIKAESLSITETFIASQSDKARWSAKREELIRTIKILQQRNDD